MARCERERVINNVQICYQHSSSPLNNTTGPSLTKQICVCVCVGMLFLLDQIGQMNDELRTAEWIHAGCQFGKISTLQLVCADLCMVG